jgi:exopolysaccharide production protein ExoZ
MTERAAFIDNVQVLRAAAALLVVGVHSIDIAQHYPGSSFRVIGGLENVGAAGVDLFFVISGFIIAHTAFIGTRRRPMDFALQRFWRVVPLYWLLSLPYALMPGGLAFEKLVATLLFWPASNPHLLSTPVMLIGWTLFFEMLFYAAATIVLWRPGRATLAMVLVAYALCWFLAQTTGLAAFQFLGNPLILEFLLGVVIAHGSARLPAWLGPLALLVGLAWFVGTIVLGLEGRGFHDPAVWSRLLVWGMPSALIVLGAVVMPPWRPAALFKPLLLVGAASYSIYLAHPLALWLLQDLLRVFDQHWNGLLVLLACVTVSVLGGLLVYRCVERPILALRPRLGGTGAQWRVIWGAGA